MRIHQRQYFNVDFSDEVTVVAINGAARYCVIDPLNQRIRQ